MTEWYRECPRCKNGVGIVVKTKGRIRELRCLKCGRRFKRAFRIKDLRKEKPAPPG